ncbi:hypothetical protein BDV23DRAFT_177205 [Aspergillus alliaceus]|uniref:Uncharacterized protein n=1 Tax=Petromyces alliaceus TaxID=209559 RepID=A0A5N7BQW9_PETAA|nr:hypothetical protein BDV23DRAFT_177205 [Aspergillus alliaceus]
MRRHRRPKLDPWAEEIIDDIVRQHGEEIQTQFFQSRTPDVDLLEKHIKEANTRIRTANLKHSVHKDQNIIPEGLYRNHFQTWMNLVNSDVAKNDPDKAWEAYYQTHKIIRLSNREYHLPDEWNFPPDATRDIFCRVDYSDESESEDSDLDDMEGIDGIDALESRMREEYSALSRGKVLYWWPIGTGTQVFVRYGPKKKPIYRVRAGSSEVFDKRSTELVLSQTRGTRKQIVNGGGFRKEVWEYSSDQVMDIIGVGWKIEDDDEHGVNALALIRPRKDAVYPHTRALVKWKDGKVTLERRGFVRRIAMGNSANGDRMLYLKARELENAYWGYDVEYESDTEASDRESSQEQRPPKNKRRSSQSKRHPQKKKGHKYVTETDTESDADSVSSLEVVRSKRRGGSSKQYKKEADIDDTIRRLARELEELKLKKQKSQDKKKASSQRRRRS